jgi:uncharacterized protein
MPESDFKRHRSRGRLTRAIARPPFIDEFGRKGWFERISAAQPHLIRHLRLEIEGWPAWPRALRVAFLADFHTGSHARDVARLTAIVDEVAGHLPDLVLFGGDYINMQLCGGGRIPPSTIAAVLSRLNAPLGRFAVLGNHDYTYGEAAVAAALRTHDITVLDHERAAVTFESHRVEIVGLPDARAERPRGLAMLAGLSIDQPTIALAHDPVWFARLPNGPHLMLAGHTHGGQIRLPGVGVLRNASKAPLRWSYGLIREEGRCMYVTSGLGTSGIPFRWNVPPEFVILELSGKPHYGR